MTTSRFSFPPGDARTLFLAAALGCLLTACRADPAPPPDVEAPPAEVDTTAPQGLTAPLYPATKTIAAPDFSLQTRDGKPFRLSDQRGKVVVLNFWATWCPPCRAEMPDFVALQDELGDRGLVFAGVSLDQEGWDVVRPFVRAMGVNYPVMVDDGTAASLYGPIGVMPTTFLIDRAGNVRYYAPGMLTREALRPVLLELLALEG